MAYTPTNWECGDVVTAELLNKLEEAVENLSVIVDGMDGGGGLVITVDHTGQATKDQCPGGGKVFYTNTTWQEVYDAMHSQKVVTFEDGKDTFTIVNCSRTGGVYRAFFVIPDHEDTAIGVGLLAADSANGQLYSLECQVG